MSAKDFHAQQDARLRRRQSADERGIEGPTMKGAELKTIRKAAGIGLYEFASLLRYRDVDGLRRIEDEDRLVSGPIQLCAELVREGLLNPDDVLR